MLVPPKDSQPGQTVPLALPNRILAKREGDSQHQIFENVCVVRSTKEKDEMKGAGEVRADTLSVVLRSLVYSSRGIYQIEPNPGITRLEPDDLPKEHLTSTGNPSAPLRAGLAR